MYYIMSIYHYDRVDHLTTIQLSIHNLMKNSNLKLKPKGDESIHRGTSVYRLKLVYLQ